MAPLPATGCDPRHFRSLPGPPVLETVQAKCSKSACPHQPPNPSSPLGAVSRTEEEEEAVERRAENQVRMKGLAMYCQMEGALQWALGLAGLSLV